MKISAIQISSLFTENEDIYEKAVVSARRQRQIIQSRALQLEAFQDIEDTEQLEQFDNIDHDVEKPLAVAMEELLNNELEWNYPSEEEPEK